MAVVQTHNKLPGTNIPFPSLPSHHIKTLASVVMSAKGVRFLLTSNRQSRASKASQGVQPQVRGFAASLTMEMENLLLVQALLLIQT